NNRLLYLVTKSIGKSCVATITNGARYQGLLVSADLSPTGSSALSVVLMNPVNVGKSLIAEKSNIDSNGDHLDKLIIQSKDLIDLEVIDVDLADVASNEESKFKTDTDISGRTQFKERELQRWVPDEDIDHPALNFNSNDTFGESSTGQWDQFKVNEEKFGVEASYDEHLYTTRINTSAPDYHERVAKAEKLAREIESSATTDRHILEERGLQVDDSGIDEEDKYSGVDRRGDELMAALRNASISNDTQKPETKVPEDVAGVSVAKAAKNTVPVKPDSIPAKPQVSQQPHNESFRLNAQSEINSLREFSANFKIPHKMPSDLLPILTKDKLKQDEILKKQEQKKLQNEIEATSASQSQSNSEAQSQSQSPSKAKIDVAKPTFKLNPKAAAFTPASKHTQISPTPPKASYHRSPNNPSPRMNHQRPFSNGSVSSGSSVKRHHQISPADFFGGADRIPTKESQIKKVESFQFAFNLFVTTRKRHAEKNEKSEKKSDTVVYDKTFQTPPTWDSTFDDTHDKLFPALSYVNAPAIPNAYGGAPAGSKYPVSPHQQQAAAAAMAAHFQQQQFHAAMMYQQQFPVGIPPGQPPMHMYPGGEPPFMPPGGFMPPPGGFVAGGSPVNGNMMLNPYNAGGHNYNSHH
ncbi:poly(A)-binding protein binding protein, partial [Scheffersomyces stipitis CBS 6054]